MRFFLGGRKTYSYLKSNPREICSFIKKETMTKVFFCEFCEISRSTFFTVHLQTTASEIGTRKSGFSGIRSVDSGSKAIFK